jgi:hypothetical protein
LADLVSIHKHVTMFLECRANCTLVDLSGWPLISLEDGPVAD